MKSFSKLYSDFWINYDNSEVVGLGMDAQLMALYLQGNSHHNMLGVYYLPLLYIASDLKIPVEQVQVVLEKLCKINYCKYDKRTQHVWVCNLAFDQIGEDVDIKDNRIKALDAVWMALPSKLEFLEEIYQRYYADFHLEPRVFEKPLTIYEIKETKEIRDKKNEMAVTDVSLGINKNTNDNIGITASTHTDTATNSNVNTDTQLSIEPLHLLISPFEAPSEYFESPDEGGGRDDVFENNLPIPPSKLPQVSLEDFFAFSDTKTSSDTFIIYEATLDGNYSERNEKSDVILTPSKPLVTTFGGSSKPLASPFEGASDSLRSNIEDRSKIIEVRSKKEEIEEELEKEKRRDINKNIVLTPNIVAQEEKARQGGGEELPEQIFFEETEKIEEIEKMPSVQSSGDFPIILGSSNLEPKAELKTKSKVKNDVDDSIATVFEHWKVVMGHPRSNLDRKRKVLISSALQLDYGTQQLCEAVTGCSYTPHNIGQNERGQRYDGLHIILRDADQIDRFIYNCHHPPKPFTEADQRLQANKYVAKNWIKKKLEESSGIRRNSYV